MSTGRKRMLLFGVENPGKRVIISCYALFRQACEALRRRLPASFERPFRMRFGFVVLRRASPALGGFNNLQSSSRAD